VPAIVMCRCGTIRACGTDSPRTKAGLTRRSETAALAFVGVEMFEDSNHLRLALRFEYGCTEWQWLHRPVRISNSCVPRNAQRNRRIKRWNLGITR
jgi:hypothetical protein